MTGIVKGAVAGIVAGGRSAAPGVIRVLCTAVIVLVLSTGLFCVSPGFAADTTRGSTPSASPTASWRWPLAAPRIVRGFEAPATRYAPGHRGIDLAASPGATVYAVADGVVTFAGTVVDRPLVTLRVSDGTLASLEPVASALHPGDPVRAGAAIGRVAEGGHCRDHCLHLGLRVDGDYVSPLTRLASVPRAVLLPWVSR